ncbi:MAG: helix-turn-helix domain-containing protein, partial [Actinomycetota bacterium]
GVRVVKRSYGQYCGLAAALDLLGERWTLLVVRDLLPGPRRYQDLLDGLPGLATDLLTARLRTLESAGLVERRRLESPGRGWVYELTERGASLRPIIEGLALWGGDLLPAPAVGPDAAHRLDPRWAMASMAAAYRAHGRSGDAALPCGDYRFVFVGAADEPPLTLTVTVRPDRARLRYGRRDDTPVLTVRGATVPLLSVLSTRSTPAQAGVEVDGDAALLEQLVDAMPVPHGVATGQ